ncbi:MAG: hypothetical protein RL204_427 [Bacteroidota bacterium]|jgi:hypothetical protein
MKIEDWFKFTDNLKQRFPEAEVVIDRESRKIINEYNELRVNASYQVEFGKPIDPDQIISDRIDHNLPEFEKKFFDHYEECGIDVPDENRFDTVRHHYPETEFERGDETLNSYAERFQNLKDEFNIQEASKGTKEEEKSPNSFDSYAERFLALKGLSLEQNTTKDEISLPDVSKDYDVDINMEYGYANQAYLQAAYRDNREDLTKEKDQDLDKD